MITQLLIDGEVVEVVVDETEETPKEFRLRLKQRKAYLEKRMAELGSGACLNAMYEEWKNL